MYSCIEASRTPLPLTAPPRMSDKRSKRCMQDFIIKIKQLYGINEGQNIASF